MRDVSLNKEKIHENLQQQYRHAYSTYENRTKEMLDLQGKVMVLEKKVSKLEVARPKETSESSKGKEGPSVQWNVVPYTH